MKLDVVTIKGEKTGRSIELSDEIFGIEPNDHCIYLDVKQYLNNWRQGTHKVKQRNEVSGSTRKLRKQKGGGGARVGSIKNPTFRGGGRMHGPQPRDYGFKLNKKVKLLARKSAFSYKLKDNAIMIVEDFAFQTPKTKDFLNIMKSLNLENKKVLTVTPTVIDSVSRSGSNLPNVSILHTGNLNTYQLLNAESIVLFESSVQHITENLS